MVRDPFTLIHLASAVGPAALVKNLCTAISNASDYQSDLPDSAFTNRCRLTIPPAHSPPDPLHVGSQPTDLPRPISACARLGGATLGRHVAADRVKQYKVGFLSAAERERLLEALDAHYVVVDKLVIGQAETA
jgi:hypothetical protein